jgi:hypothetical protein
VDFTGDFSFGTVKVIVASSFEQNQRLPYKPSGQIRFEDSMQSAWNSFSSTSSKLLAAEKGVSVIFSTEIAGSSDALRGLCQPTDYAKCQGF